MIVNNEKLKKIVRFLVLGGTVLSGIVGNAGLAVAGIAIYLTCLEIDNG